MDTRECRKCNKNKPLDQFYYRPSKRVYYNHCKQCELRSSAAFQQTEKRKAWRRQYRMKKKTNATQEAAWQDLNLAVKNGDIQRPESCSKCGSGKRIQAHHVDYSKPFDVTWVCELCHKKIHSNGCTAQAS